MKVKKRKITEPILRIKETMLVAQYCPTLCNPMDYSPPGSSVHGILQAQILEWVVTPFSTQIGESPLLAIGTSVPSIFYTASLFIVKK